MEKSTLGKTGLEVTRLGAGLAAIGEELTMDEVDRAGRVLNAALDGGINFLDTSANYDISEELVGRSVAHRRDEYILATKCGAVKDKAAVDKWTAQLIRDHIDRSLTRMKTDHLDVVQLHSCSVEVLERGEATEALLEAQRAGKTRFVGYSGDNEAALWAVESGLFDTLQTSFSIADQHARTRLFGPAKARNMGIIIKRPIANGAWGSERSPTADLRHAPMRTYGDEYFRRVQLMAQIGPIEGIPDDRFLAAIGFVLGHAEVDTAIVGTQNPAHMADNIERVERGLPVPLAAIEELRRRFDELDDGWDQRI
jgi:aryl-alcohol dehydrogenase-like predicted oxidoreductase